jgi:hypothetical protein
LVFLFLNLKATAKPFTIFIVGILVAWGGAQLAGIELWK